MRTDRVVCAQIDIMYAKPVSIEIDISPGLFNFKIVGLASKSVDEAKERINSAIKRIGYKAPKHSNRKTVISLTPADMPKKGAHFDAAIAINYLIETKQIKPPQVKTLVVGELSFNGDVSATDACRIIAVQAQMLGVEKILLPKDAYSPLLDSIPVKKVFCSNLEDVITEIESTAREVAQMAKNKKTSRGVSQKGSHPTMYLIDTVQGNDDAKRAIIIALSGGHHISFCGVPGTGKTLLAKSASELLPNLSLDEAIISSSLHLMKGIQKNSLTPPFRDPHHTSSTQSIIGGGSVFKPGEISLAHKGILFMDEFLEFKKEVIEGLRNVLESKSIIIHRANYSIETPCDCLTVIAYNPCPCGYAGSSTHRCSCTASNILSYMKKLSGPIADRIDLHVYIEKITYEKLSSNHPATNVGARMAEKISGARKLQLLRQNKLNSDLNHADVLKLSSLLDNSARIYLNKAAQKLSLSARGYHSVIKVAQTISDIETVSNPQHKNSSGLKETAAITKKAVQEALYFRSQYRD